MEQLDLLQFGSLVGSLNRHRADERAARVHDAAMGAQADDKTRKEHVKAIRAAAGQKDPGALGSRAFNARFGVGTRKPKAGSK